MVKLGGVYTLRKQVQLELEWQPASALSDLPIQLGEWILHAGSFMKKLRQHGVEHPRVQLLRQGWQFPALNEKRALGMTMRMYALIREVLIYSQGKNWMYARTVFPRQTLTGKQLCLARLKNHSLGSVLFKDPTMQRSSFEVACLSQNMLLHQFVSQQIKIKTEPLWARRSQFFLHNKPLLLTEIFLPDIETLCS